MAAISLLGLVVGLVSAFATIGFVELVRYLNEILYVSTASRSGLEQTQLWWITIAVLTTGGLVVGLSMQFGVERGVQTGPADTIYAVQLQERLPTPRSGVVSTVTAILSLGCGASVGQYGPLVYLGTLIGQVTNRLPFGLSDVRSIAIACGVAAAISTAFNAPIAALIFTHEVILRHYSLRMFAAVTVASACGYLVANVVFEHPPLFLIEFDGSFRGVEFFLFALEGIACGALAVLFMKMLYHAEKLSRKIGTPAALRPMIAGFVMALVALQVPEVLGAGQEVFDQAIVGGVYAADALLLILVAKLLVTVLCIGFGFSGGVIFPALLIGVLFGALFALLVPGQFLNDYSGLSVYAVCGMMALMSPVIGAPMTALLLVFELTRSYEITIAAMVAIVFANLIAHQWYGRSLYDFQLGERGIDLSMGRVRAYLMHHTVASRVTDSLPLVKPGASLFELRQRMAENSTASAVIVDQDNKYLGLVSQPQLLGLDDSISVGSITINPAIEFNEATSLWDAMETMRGYIGEAIPVIDSVSKRYLGAIPEAVIINAYLDAAQELRREEYEV
ncbi:MAG: chloride channel protein [Gammaproteobacteria bacterium]|nr:chloride channel protein [Gammaproteobacteria bacterium]MDH3534995.1 chloride channel protein [Gammaproteobacteria bacterium]